MSDKVARLRSAIAEAETQLAALKKALLKALLEAGEPMFCAEVDIYTDDDFFLDGEGPDIEYTVYGHSYRDVVVKLIEKINSHVVTGHKTSSWNCVKHYVLENLADFRGSDFVSPPTIHYGGNAETDISFYKRTE